MADQDFEAFHVPQQSRRDKLRVVVDNTPPPPPLLLQLADASTAGLLPSLIPSHMLHPLQYMKQEGTRGGGGGGGGGGMSYHLTNTTAASSSTCSSSSSSSSSSHHRYSLDPQQPLPLNSNYTSIQDANNQYYFFTPQGGATAAAVRESDFSSSFNRHSGGAGLAVPTPMQMQYIPQPQALSLSLSSHHHPFNFPRSLPACVGTDTSTSNDIRSAVPLGPFTGYASILKGSRFLLPAQQLLDDFCYVGQPIYHERDSGDSINLENLNDAGVVDHLMACTDGGELCKKKTRLISMLDEVYKRYKLYYQQMQTVVASFESVAGLANAAPYTSFALKAMSKHFRSLKNAIVDQLRFSSKSAGEGSFKRSGNTDEVWIHDHRPARNSIHQPVWRPQRGLPERAVTVLRAWLFEHFLHPYPSDADKQTLAKQTGLSRSQVSNWFINARVRLWKPMVEEIHMLETCQPQTELEREADTLPSGNSSHFNKQHQIRSSSKAQDHTSKRSRNQHLGPDRACESMNFACNTATLASNPNAGAGVGTSSGVSLTLGLQQNNVIGLSEALPMNIARRFGLEASNEGYMGNFEGQIQHFSKDIGGRLLHDFVG